MAPATASAPLPAAGSTSSTSVIWQSCSGGGGRADLGILSLADQIWVSDNTEPTARLQIQEGVSQLFPASTMESWVTDTGPAYLPVSFRFHVSMCGTLGIGGHLLRWSEAQRTEAAGLVALYKEIRPIVHLGDQYRLRSPSEHPYSAIQFMAKDRSAGVLFAFRTHLPEPVEIPVPYPRGLDPLTRYSIEGLPGTRSGLAWMHAGLQLPLHDFQSTLRRIQQVEAPGG